MRFVYKALVVFAITLATLVTVVVGQVVLMSQTGWGIGMLPLHGMVVGELEGVTIHSAAWFSFRGRYGLEYQCVELVNRFYAVKLGHKNMTKHGDADSYFWDPWSRQLAEEQGVQPLDLPDKGLVAYENGGQEPPKQYDILVFDGGNSDGSVGHVALIAEVDHRQNTLRIVQQNTPQTRYYILRHYRWQDELSFSRTKTGGWYVSEGDFSIPVAGWSRRKEAP
jgi:hypothetical protein